MTLLFSVKSEQKHLLRDNKYKYNLILEDDKLKEFCYEIWNTNQTIKAGYQVSIDNPEFETNQNKLIRKQIRFQIKTGTNYVVIPNENESEINAYIRNTLSNTPLTIPCAFPSSVHHGIYLVEQMKITKTNNNSFMVFGTITDNINTKLYFKSWNHNNDISIPKPEQMALVRGCGCVIRTKKFGIQFQFINAVFINITRNQQQSNALFEEKRTLYLVPKPMQISSKEYLSSQSLTEFIAQSNGLKHTVHSKVFRIFVNTLDLYDCIKQDRRTQQWFFIGTLFAGDTLDGQIHRVKIKNKPMADIIFEETAEEARGYQRDPERMENIMDKIEGKYWDICVMYAYAPKPLKAPARKRRRLDYGNVYCESGFVSITSMAAVAH